MCEHDWKPHKCARLKGDHFICRRCGDEMARSLPVDYQKRLLEESKGGANDQRVS